MKLKDILKNIQNENCGCGCHTCDISRSTKLINESTRLQISEDLLLVEKAQPSLEVGRMSYLKLIQTDGTGAAPLNVAGIIMLKQ